MSPIRHSGSRRGAASAFVCRYVERTLAQLGEEALSLPLVSRHLLLCPSCRAQRRRVSRLDTALRDSLLAEMPPYFNGRWKDLQNRVGAPLAGVAEPPKKRRHRSLYALVMLFLLLGAGWWSDMHPAAHSVPTQVAPGITVTGALVGGQEARVQAEPTTDDDGTVYLWVIPEGTQRPGAGIGPH